MTAIVERTHPVQQALDDLRHRALGNVINGHLEPAADDVELFDVVNPSTGEVIVGMPLGSADDVDRAVAAARAALPVWRATSPAARQTVLTAVADVIDQHIDELAALESLNTGKPYEAARGEMPGVATIFRFTSGAARALQAPATEEYLEGHVSMLRREPLGVIGAITPWNYPLTTASWKIASALAMGNTLVLKPAELTPLTTVRFMELVADVLPPGLVNVVLGTGAEIGTAISQHPGIDMVSLTGSVASGQRVVADSSKTLKPSHLELGGKAPVLVFEDADLDRVVETVRFAGFYNAGQECGAATRILCHESVRAALTERLIEAASTIRMGAPDGDDVELGPLVSNVHRERVAAMVERARDAGAVIALGGVPTPGDGYFYPPTIITDIAPGSEIAVEEIFGPVVTIETFADEGQAIALANETPYGLASSVWTHDLGRSMRTTSALDFGTVWVNTHLALAEEMPWGGYGASGHGRECSTLGLEDFSRTKHVMFATS